MSPTGPSERAEAQRRRAGSNKLVAVSLAGFVAFMVGLSFAAVPLYRMFCAATGFAGTPQRAAAGPIEVHPETVTVRFDANVAPNLPWSFQAVQSQLTLHIGETKLAFFRATNRSSETVTGSAVFNVSPSAMGQYFTKIQCFCFTEQTLKPGETVEMPVSFFIGPAVLEDSEANTAGGITLSYTFYRVQKPASAPRADVAQGRANASPAIGRNPG